RRHRQRERVMAFGVRRTLVWATIAAAIGGAVMLASSGAGLPRLDTSARPGAAPAGTATPLQLH
ncbi:MAG TPA: hypothetical protein VFA35_08270, partial [Burkholderiaceae bacterium]|nr:hypothetical protein [Burkholderiaceae bacterium]